MKSYKVYFSIFLAQSEIVHIYSRKLGADFCQKVEIQTNFLSKTKFRKKSVFITCLLLKKPSYFLFWWFSWVKTQKNADYCLPLNFEFLPNVQFLKNWHLFQREKIISEEKFFLCFANFLEIFNISTFSWILLTTTFYLLSPRRFIFILAHQINSTIFMKEKSRFSSRISLFQKKWIIQLQK